LFNSQQIDYDFSEDIGAAYGCNLKRVSDRYCIYAGDINQDGIVDSGDFMLIDNLISSFAIGYFPEDLNGDGLLDSEDLIIIDNNSSGFVGKLIP